MYKLYSQIDRQKHEEEKKDDIELYKLDALLNSGPCRRDSFSTITTHETELIIQRKDSKPLDITWNETDGLLPLEISVPENSNEEKDPESPPRVAAILNDVSVSNDTPPVLPTSLYVDDDEELDLIFDDDNDSDIRKTLEKVTASPVSEPSENSSLDDVNLEDDILRFETERFTRFEI